jgi:hypothetical protein
MWRRILVAATVGLVSVAVPVSAQASAPSSVPSRLASADTCLAALPSGTSGTVTCLSHASPSASLRKSSAAPVVASAADPGAPDIAGCGFNSWTLGRHSACTTQNDWVLNVFAVVENGPRTLVGQIPFTITSGTVTSGVSTRWTHNFTMSIGLAWGNVSGTEVFAEPECLAACGILGAGFDFGAATSGSQHSGRAQLQTTSPGPGYVWIAGSAWWFKFANPAWVNPVSETIYVTPPGHRCDEAIGIPGSIGCVYAQKRPVHEIGQTRWPMYARHVQLAINFGLPSVLTRTMIREQQDANRAVACPRSPSNGTSCDEYPFASTHEGAANPMHPYGRTFMILNWNSGYPPFYCGINWVSPRAIGDSRGYSVCGIPAVENSGGGTDLGVFYVANRVIHNDQFAVRVVP